MPSPSRTKSSLWSISPTSERPSRARLRRRLTSSARAAERRRATSTPTATSAPTGLPPPRAARSRPARSMNAISVGLQVVRVRGAGGLARPGGVEASEACGTRRRPRARRCPPRRRPRAARSASGPALPSIALAGSTAMNIGAAPRTRCARAAPRRRPGRRARRPGRRRRGRRAARSAAAGRRPARAGPMARAPSSSASERERGRAAGAGCAVRSLPPPKSPPPPPPPKSPPPNHRRRNRRRRPAAAAASPTASGCPSRPRPSSRCSPAGAAEPPKKPP